jgi:hypothetical protein
MSQIESTAYSNKLRPNVCPCCGAPIVYEQNADGQERQFSYACGSTGSQGEEYQIDPTTFERKGNVLRDPVEWSSLCAHFHD